MQCVILAGGLGTRMAAHTAARPKALIEVAGEPFLRHQLRLLAGHGISDVVISTGYRAEMIEDEVTINRPMGMRIRCVPDGDVLLGTGGALRRCLDQGALAERFFVLYGDSYLLVDYAAVWAAFDPSRYRALMTVWPNADRLDASNVVYRGGRVELYCKRADRSAFPGMDHVDWGLSVLTAAIVGEVEPGHPCDLADVCEGLSRRGELQGYEVHQRFYEIGSPAGLADLEELLTTSRSMS